MGKPFLLLAMMAIGAFAQPTHVGWSTGYYPTWSSAPFTQIRWKSYTHMCYFALVPNASGGISGISAANAKNFVAEAHRNKVKAIICVGGDGTDGNFNTATANASTRTTLVRNIVAFVQANGFDGLDMDWESKSDNAARVKVFYDFHKELRDSLDRIATRPIMTAAIADWYPKCSAALLPLCEQLNAMSYWSLVGAMDGFMKPLLDLGIPKAKLGVGMGFDTDGEVDVDNPKDVALKCHYAMDKGYGGIMVWDIMRGTAEIHDSIAKYVNQDAVGILVRGNQRIRNGARLSILVDGAAGTRRVAFMRPSADGLQDAAARMGLFDARGAWMPASSGRGRSDR